MKIIVRDSTTGLYYGGHEFWCAEVSEATNFDSIGTAASAAQEQKIETVKVVLRFDEPICELALPLALCLFNDAESGTKGKDQHPRHPD